MSDAIVMVVEDEDTVAKSLQHSLEYSGYCVPAVVSSGEKAIEKAGEIYPDLVLMDIVLNGHIDGISAAAEIYKKYRIPVIYITAYDDDITIERAKKTAPLGYLVKPIKHKELQVAIEIALKKNKLDKKQQEVNRAHLTLQKCIQLANESFALTKRKKEEFKIVQTKDLLEEIYQNLNEILPQTIQIRPDIQERLWAVVGNYDQLFWAVMNLCTDACNAMTEGGQLNLTAENVIIAGKSSLMNIDSDLGPYVVITVADTGKAFSIDGGHRVFELFSFMIDRHEKDTWLDTRNALDSEKDDGSDYETSYTVVKDHGGFISLYYDSKRGARITVFLPALA